MKKRAKEYGIQREVTQNNTKSLKIFIVILFIALLGIGTFTGVYVYKSLNSTAVKEKVYVSLGDIMVNLSDEQDKRYFKGNISIGYDKGDKKAKKQLTDDKQLVVVKDAINFYLKSKSASFVVSGNEEEMKQDLLDCINSSLKDFKVTDIRFSSIIVQ